MFVFFVNEEGSRSTIGRLVFLRDKFGEGGH
jgi:hypothetical protein